MVRFDASKGQYLQMPDFMSSATAGEVVVVVRSGVAATGVNNGLMRFGASDDWYPNANGNLYSSTGSTGQYLEGVPAQSLSQFNVYEESSQAGLWQSWVNGVPFFTSAANAVGFSTAPWLGRTNGYGYFTGDIAEVLVYNRALSDAERRSVRAYLTQKYLLAPAPAAPSSLSARQLSPTENLVSWTGVADNAPIDYVVQRATSLGGAYTAVTGLNSYDYDAAGNRTTATQMNQATIQYTPDGENRYASSTYDGNGNTTDSVVGWTYKYDAEGKLIHAENGAGQFVDCHYDGLGRLVWRNVNGAARRFCYAGAQRLEERAADTGAVLAQYFYDAPGGGALLLRDDTQWGRLWYQRDAFGHTTHLSDNAGNVVEQYTYDAYGTPAVYDGAGNPRAGGSLYDNRSLWNSASGYEWLAGPGLYHAGARFYLPQHGRWLQPDPIGQAGGLNLYTYCGNDPVNGADPSGLAEDEGSAPKQNYGYDANGQQFNASGDNSANPDVQGGGWISNDRMLAGNDGPGASASTNGPLTTNTSDPAISWGASWGVARDPLADPHGTRNFFGGIASGAASNLLSQARSTLDLIGGNPLVNALNDAVFTGAESLLNSAGSSLAGSLGINSQSAAYQAGAPGGEFLAGAGLLLSGLGEAEAAETTMVDVDAMANAAAEADRGGLTRAGRAMDKHGMGQRSSTSPFPAVKGGVAEKNAMGQFHVEDMLTHPDATFTPLGRGGMGVRVPDGRAMRFDANGRFAGFIE